MALKQNLTTQRTQAQETQTKTIEFILPDGPHFDIEANEYQVWFQADIVAWCEDIDQAWQSYYEAIDAHFNYVHRTVLVTGNGGTKGVEVDWYTCPDCGASVDSGAECHICNQPELPDTGDWFIINHADGKTSISRNGSVRFEEAL